MPRPGPRPYECVRRAWHSDRHQPIRGSLIQEIFRVVNEVHTSATKKNKEWQEKLPVVVLKAEEIMYSKANSAAEYMDPKTLWDRTNDAINTIIRRDESIETGQLLQPCIEAALNLGCIPRKASRSQRNSHPRCYLNPCNQHPNSFSPSMVPNTIQENHAANSQCLPYSKFIKATVMNSFLLSPEPHDLIGRTENMTSNKLLSARDNVPSSNINQCLPMENYPASSLYSVYPLYYGSCLEPEHDLGVVSKSLLVTTEPANVDAVQNLFSCNENSAPKINRSDIKETPLNPQKIVCDLSLRLGTMSAPVPNVGNRKLLDFQDVDYGCSEQGCKINSQMPQGDKEFSLSTAVNVDGPLASCSIKLSEHLNIGAPLKKRKAVFDHLVDNQHVCRQPNLKFGHLADRMKSAGS